MKHKVLGFITVFLLLISLISCSSDATVFSDSSLQAIPASSRSEVLMGCYYVDVSNLKELSKMSDYIVVGTLQDNAKQKITYKGPNNLPAIHCGATIFIGLWTVGA